MGLIWERGEVLTASVALRCISMAGPKSFLYRANAFALFDGSEKALQRGVPATESCQAIKIGARGRPRRSALGAPARLRKSAKARL